MPAHTEGQKYGRKDEQTLFHRTFPATAGGRISFPSTVTILHKKF